MNPPVIEISGVSKTYGQTVACDDVNMEFRAGQIHGLLGQNGAGKSTIMKILIGLVEPDFGEVRLRGEVLRISDPADALNAGIAMVHQHLSLVPALLVWENVILGERRTISRSSARRIVEQTADRYGLEVDPDARVADLTAGQRQRVELVKCLRKDPDFLILDEPTSVLSPGESRELFSVLRSMIVDHDRAVALISHKLNEVRYATDEVTIMRNGRIVVTGPTDSFDVGTMAREMIGHEVSGSDALLIGAVTQQEPIASDDVHQDLTYPKEESSDSGSQRPALSVQNASLRSGDGRILLDELSFHVFPGEILGLAGVEGNGQSALADVLASILTLDAGTVEVQGRTIKTGWHGAMSRAGVGMIPEDRHLSGAVMEMSVAENLVLDNPQVVATYGVMNLGKLRRYAVRLIEEFGVKCPGPDAPMWQLSGGNQQRVVLARELSRSPVVLVAAQPTRGLDVGAVEWMADRLRAASRAGVSVLLISSELEELCDLADRIAVIFRGRIVGEMPAANIDIEGLGTLMGGASA